jgi:DNA-binding XRE family transcriptional regulator
MRSASDYARERKLRGTQKEVAAKLGVIRETIARRETGDREITEEAWIALMSLPTRKF